MKTQFVTKKNLLIGIMGSILEFLFSNKVIIKDRSRNYSFVSSLKAKEVLGGRTVGIYQDSMIKEVIIKRLIFRFKNLNYFHLLQEASLLHLLNKYRDGVRGTVFVPKIFKISERRNSLEIITQRVKGKTLINYNTKQKFITLEKTIFFLRNLSKKMNLKERKAMPVRNSTFFLITFPLYLAIATIKLKSFKLFNLLSIFYQNYNLTKMGRFGFVHRDLHSQNILIKGKQTYIIDFEVGSMSDEQTDVALIPILYHREIPIKEIMTFLDKFTKDEQETRRIIWLNIFYTIQLIALQKKDSDYYRNIYEYIDKLFHYVLPLLQNKAIRNIKRINFVPNKNRII